MHGRPRLPKGLPEDPHATKASRDRLAKFARVCNEVLRRVQVKQFDEESLKLAAALLEQNPECYTVWNYRRTALQDTLKGQNGSAAASKAAEGELVLTERALRKNPKSYASWHHRRWILETGLCSLDKELKLLNQLMEQDGRNFLSWAYRRFVVKLAGISPDSEEQYATDLINANFSNYSAWHARTTLLHAVHGENPVISLEDLLARDKPGRQTSTCSGSTPRIPLRVLQEEFDLVQQAFFTDPEDQSAWLYHRWLVGNVFSHFSDAAQTVDADARKELGGMLAKEADMCDELLQVEPDRSRCKWPLLTLARLKELQQELDPQSADQTAAIQNIYEQLIVIDPMRQGYYTDAIKGSARVMLSPVS